MTQHAFTRALLLTAATLACTTATLDAQDPRLSSMGALSNSVSNTAKKRLQTAYANAGARKKRSHSSALNQQRQTVKSAKWAFDTAVRNADKWLGGKYRAAGNTYNSEFRKIQATRRPGKIAIDRTLNASYRKIEYDRQNLHKSARASITRAYASADAARNRVYSAADRAWKAVQARGRTDRQATDRLASSRYAAASNRYVQAKAAAGRAYKAAQLSNYRRASRMAANIRTGWHGRANRTAYQTMQRTIASAKRAMDTAVRNAKAARTTSYNAIVSRERTTWNRGLAAKRRAATTQQSARKTAYSRWQSQIRSADAAAKRARTGAFNRCIAAKKQLEATIARKVSDAKRTTARTNANSKSVADAAKRKAKVAYDQRVRAAAAVAATAFRKANDREMRERKLAYASYARSIAARR